MAMASEDTVAFEDGWAAVKSRGLDWLRRRLDLGLASSRAVLPAAELAELYTLVYRMCTQPTPHNWSGKLYYTVLDELRTVCEDLVEPRLREAGPESEALLGCLIEEWDKHMAFIKALQGILGYLDRFYVQRLALLTLRGAAIKAFLDGVLTPNAERIQQAFLELVAHDRCNPAEDETRKVLRRTTDILIAVGQGSVDEYEAVLLEPLLAASEEHMAREAQALLASCSCTQYLYRVRAMLNAEGARVDAFLHPDSRGPLLKVCERQLISAHLQEILELRGTGCRWLLETDANDVLHLMFVLLRRVPNGLAPMGLLFRKFLQESGADLLAKPQYENQWNNLLDDTLIYRLVLLHQKYRALVRDCFEDHNTFHRALKEAFEFFINLPLPQDELSAIEADAGAEEGGVGNRQEQQELLRRRRRRRRPRSTDVTISELLSDYLDRKLRKSAAQMVPVSPLPGEGDTLLTPRHEATLEREVAVTVVLFGYINDKDVFGQFYRKHLAKRLILGRSASMDAERVVINSLKASCGNPFVSKFTGMIKDLMLAKETQRDFLRHVVEAAHASSPGGQSLGEAEQGSDLGSDPGAGQEGSGEGVNPAAESLPMPIDPAQPLGFDVNVTVLTSGFWPSYQTEAVSKLPDPLRNVMQCFQQFYHSRTAHRTLSWVHALGSLVLTAVFANGSKVDITVSTVQGALLLLFNQRLRDDRAPEEGARLSVEEMAAQVGCTSELVRKEVHSLVKGKYALLREHADPSAPDDASYSLNWSFEARARKIRVPRLPAQKAAQSKEDRASALLKISEERRYAVEAAIMRLMKAHNTMRYADLSERVVASLRHIFQPQPKTIRQRVDDLVQRDYLELDDTDPTMLTYVA